MTLLSYFLNHCVFQMVSSPVIRGVLLLGTWDTACPSEPLYIRFLCSRLVEIFQFSDKM